MGLADIDGQEYFLSENVQVAALEAMIQLAEKEKIDDAAAAVVVEKEGSNIQQARYAAIKSSGGYFGSVMAMVATMKRTGLFSERGGGWMRQEGGYTIYVAFSGNCRNAKNLEIAELGMKVLFPKQVKG